MLEELRGNILVRHIVSGKLQGDLEHVQAEHRHPTCAIGLLQRISVRQNAVAIEHANVIKPQETTLEYVVAVLVLPVHPPCEVQKQLVENLLQELNVADTGLATFDGVDAPGGPGMHQRVYVSE